MMRRFIAVAAMAAIVGGCSEEATLVLDCELTEELNPLNMEVFSIGHREVFRISTEVAYGVEADGCFHLDSASDELVINGFTCDSGSSEVCEGGRDYNMELNRLTGELTVKNRCGDKDGGWAEPFVWKYQCQRAEQRF